MNFEQARFKMVEQQIRPWKVLDPQVLAVLGAVPRELFTPPEYQFMAYVDEEIPLAGGHVMLPHLGSVTPRIQTPQSGSAS